MVKPSLVLALASTIFASPTPSAPTATIKNGTVVGRNANEVDSFIGIPFVQPPVGDLRLRAPQTITKPFGRLVLPETAAACIQMNVSTTDTTGLDPRAVEVMGELSTNFTGLMSEDCLTVTVQRPVGIPKHKKLPVLFWIYGGGWTEGSTQGYDGTAIVLKSVEMGEPVIFVAANYRLNAFGFLHGRQMQTEGITNLGMRDQRKALEWVAENIDAFGGDSGRVTIWGESAGSASVLDHMLAYGGNHHYRGKPLFHAGIMNSGTIIRTQDTTCSKAQNVFDTVSHAAGCNPASSTVLDCLRKAPVDVLTQAMSSVPNIMSEYSVNLPYIPRPDGHDGLFSEFPEVSIAAGRYARVPVIMGNQEDEATIFAVAQRHIINSTETLVNYFADWLKYAPRDMVADLVATYPDDPAAGLPARTGNDGELYPQFKRNAAIQTDLGFTMGRREALSHMASKIPAWSYLATYQHGFPFLGTYHISDLATQFSLQVNEFAANKLDEAYIHFVNHRNPNGRNCSEQWWPKWDNKKLTLANFSSDAVGLTKDDFRWESYEFWKKHGAQLRQ